MAKKESKRPFDEDSKSQVSKKKRRHESDGLKPKVELEHCKDLVSKENENDAPEKKIKKLLKKLKNDDIIQNESEKKTLQKRLKKLKKELKKDSNELVNNIIKGKSSKEKSNISGEAMEITNGISDTDVNKEKSLRKLQKEKKRIEKLLKSEKSPSTESKKKVKKQKADEKSESDKMDTSSEITKKKRKKKVKQVNTDLEGDNTENSIKKLKGKEKKKSKSKKNIPDGETSVSDDKEDKHKNKKVVSTKRKDSFKKKRERKMEQRKLLRQEEGQFSSINKMTVEEMMEKIAEISSREKLSKTAIRRLRVLKKKLSVEENLPGKQDSEKSEPVKRKNDDLEDDIHHDENKKIKLDLREKKDLISDKSNDNVIKKRKLPDEDRKNKKAKKSKKDKKNDELFVEDRLGTLSDSKSNNTNATDDCEETLGINKLKISEKKNKENNSIVIDSSIPNDKSSKQKQNRVNDLQGNVKSIQKSEGELSSSNEDDGNEESKPEDIAQQLNELKQKPQVPKMERQNNNNQVPKKRRYVLFVGNIAYDTTTVDLKKHFLTKVSKVKDVRIPLKPDTKDPRGFAYVEVENNIDYEKALSLHGSFLKNRMIKVEYTLGGSKHASKRQEVVHKNKKLHAMRKAGMLAGSKKQRRKPNFSNPNNRTNNVS